MPNQNLVIATHNHGKSHEIGVMLGEVPWQLLTLADFSDVGVAVENGVSYIDNAILKATYYAKKTRQWTLADDSGLEVSGLDGAPGIYSARYGGDGASDGDRRVRLLAELEIRKRSDRSARFACAVAIADPTGEIQAVFEGICEGTITTQERGNSGFGYDPLFIPNGYEQTFGELSEEVKNTLSHRAKALIQARDFLMQKNGPLDRLK